jgi:WD40 repeat protein
MLLMASCNYPGLEATPTLADTPTPTKTFTPEVGPLQSNIDASNASRLSLAGEAILGEIISLSWDTSQNRAAVATLDGVHVLQFDPTLERTDISPENAAEIAVVATGGKFLALGHVDGGLTVWNIELAQEMYAREAGQETVTAIAFSPGSGILATGTLDGQAKLWSLETGQPLQEYQFDSWPESITFSPIGGLVAMDIVEHSVQLFSARSGELVNELTWEDRAGPVYYVEFSPDWDQIVWISRASALVMSVDSGEPIALLGHEDFIGTTAFSSDGMVFASTTAEFMNDDLQGVVKLWSMPDGNFLRNLIVGEAAIALAFSPDGRLLALGMPDGSVQFWEVASGSEVGELAAHGDMVFDLKFLQDGKILATASIDGSIRSWSVAP